MLRWGIDVTRYGVWGYVNLVDYRRLACRLLYSPGVRLSFSNKAGCIMRRLIDKAVDRLRGLWFGQKGIWCDGFLEGWDDAKRDSESLVSRESSYNAGRKDGNESSWADGNAAGSAITWAIANHTVCKALGVGNIVSDNPMDPNNDYVSGFGGYALDTLEDVLAVYVERIIANDERTASNTVHNCRPASACTRNRISTLAGASPALLPISEERARANETIDAEAQDKIDPICRKCAVRVADGTYGPHLL